MTRKRFVKLVMSCGIQRNQANELAKEVKTYGSYDEMYKHYRPGLFMQRTWWRGKNSVRTLSKVLTAAILPVVKEFIKVASEFEEALAKIKNVDFPIPEIPDPLINFNPEPLKPPFQFESKEFTDKIKAYPTFGAFEGFCDRNAKEYPEFVQTTKEEQWYAYAGKENLKDEEDYDLYDYPWEEDKGED